MANANEYVKQYSKCPQDIVDPYKIAFLVLDDSGSDDVEDGDQDEGSRERVLFIRDKPKDAYSDSGTDRIPDDQLNERKDDKATCAGNDVITSIEEPMDRSQQHDRQRKGGHRSRGLRRKQVSLLDTYQMQLLKMEHELKINLMAEEYQRRMELAQVEHERRLRYMDEDNKANMARHNIELEVLRTKKEILGKRINIISGTPRTQSVILDYTNE